MAPKNANNATKELEIIIKLWKSQRAYTEADFRTIDIDVGRCTWIVAADRDERVYRLNNLAKTLMLPSVPVVYRNQSDLAASWIPAAGLISIPQTSHFAFLQAPRVFNSLLRSWLEDDGCH